MTMTTHDRAKRRKVAEMNTAALRQIRETVSDVESSYPTPERPLAGLVHISGIGQVPYGWILDELRTREEAGA